MSAKIIPFPNAHERFFQNKKKQLGAEAFNDYMIHDYIYKEILVDPKDLIPFDWDTEC